jgi:hypothetical protein
MERGVRVNGVPVGGGRAGAMSASAVASHVPSDRADYGPCLYLGPAGQRCSRRAIEGGFCEQHRPDAKALVTAAPNSRRLIAILAALVALLPWLTDLIRELIRFFR